MIDDDAEYEARRQIRAQADADVAAFISSLDQDEGTGVPPPVRITVSEVSTKPVQFDPFAFGQEGSGASPIPQPPPPPVPWACCKPDNSCEMLTSAACADAGGTFHLGQTCDEVDCEPPPDCTTCDDLPPTNPSGPPVHINITIVASGTCGDVTFSGSIVYDEDLVFGSESPFCAHNVVGDTGDWVGEFVKTCAFGGSAPWDLNFGPNGRIGRDFTTCEWWLEMDMFFLFFGSQGAVGSCDGCSGDPPDSIFEVFSSPGDPSGTYVYVKTNGVVTMTITITIT